MKEDQRIGSGVEPLDLLLDGLRVGDNVVWHDDAGSLAWVFCLHFIQESRSRKRPMIYVSFDRSPKNLLDHLGPSGRHPLMTVLDCFTHGKGAGAPVFLRFYEHDLDSAGCRVIPVEKPGDPESVTEALYGVHAGMEGEVHFVFESITGMQELWGGEDQILRFYSHSCPRLYELNTIAYWILEKKAHTTKLRAQINQIAQVAVELTVRRGTTLLTVLKAERRGSDSLNRPHRYWSKDLQVAFDPERGTTGRVDLGTRLRAFRSKRGLSQKDLAGLVGVTPSTISQIESNLIYPSVPALLKMSEVLSVDVSSFFQDRRGAQDRIVFPGSEATRIPLPGVDDESGSAMLLTPVELEPRAEPYLIEIPPKQALPSHFFLHKGEELGYVLSGTLRIKMKSGTFTARRGDVIHLSSETPIQWKNAGASPARLLWLKVR